MVDRRARCVEFVFRGVLSVGCAHAFAALADAAGLRVRSYVSTVWGCPYEGEIDPQALAALSLASFAAYGLVTVACYIVVKLLKLDLQTYLAPLIFGNTGNLGLPLALFAFGDVGLGYAVVVFAVMAILSFTIGSSHIAFKRRIIIRCFCFKFSSTSINQFVNTVNPHLFSFAIHLTF